MATWLSADNPFAIRLVFSALTLLGGPSFFAFSARRRRCSVHFFDIGALASAFEASCGAPQDEALVGGDADSSTPEIEAQEI